MRKTSDSTLGRASRRRELARLIKQSGGSISLDELTSWIRIQGYHIEMLNHLQALGLRLDDDGQVRIK